MSFKGKIATTEKATTEKATTEKATTEKATTEKHDVGSGRIVQETSSGSSVGGSQTDFASLPPPYDGRHASLTRSMALQAHAMMKKYSTQRQRTLHRRSPQPFQRSTLPEDGMSQGVALQPEGERETELNAAWKKQVRADRLALNALIEANQEREAKAVLENGGHGEDLSDFNTRYQEYLGRRGLSNIEQLMRHTERLFDEL